eukprot:COSAG06_NODE_14958_length_1111_cov_1.720356_1_plen_69_part_00
MQTSWALLGLMAAGCTDTDALRRGAEFLRSRQLPSGGARHTHMHTTMRQYFDALSTRCCCVSELMGLH